MYPNVAPENVVKPYITYSRISVTPIATLDKNGGADSLINTRMQVNVWCTTYTEAQAKIDEIKTRLHNWNRQNIIKLEKDVYDPEAQLHKLILDVSIWHY